MSNSKLVLLELGMGQYSILSNMDGGQWSGRKEGWRSFGRSRPLDHLHRMFCTRAVQTMMMSVQRALRRRALWRRQRSS